MAGQMLSAIHQALSGLSQSAIAAPVLMQHPFNIQHLLVL
jgi:hypothetical protein